MLGGESGIMRAQVVFTTPSIFSELFIIHYRNFVRYSIIIVSLEVGRNYIDYSLTKTVKSFFPNVRVLNILFDILSTLMMPSVRKTTYMRILLLRYFEPHLSRETRSVITRDSECIVFKKRDRGLL